MIISNTGWSGALATLVTTLVKDLSTLVSVLSVQCCTEILILFPHFSTQCSMSTLKGRLSCPFVYLAIYLMKYLENTGVIKW